MHPFRETIERIQFPRLSETLCVNDYQRSSRSARIPTYEAGVRATRLTARRQSRISCEGQQRRTQHRLENHSISEPERYLS